MDVEKKQPTVNGLAVFCYTLLVRLLRAEPDFSPPPSYLFSVARAPYSAISFGDTALGTIAQCRLSDAFGCLYKPTGHRAAYANSLIERAQRAGLYV